MVELPKLDYAKVSEQLEGFIRRFVKRAEARGVVVGLSGGVDSSVVAYLCARSLGAKSVLGLILPERGVTPPSDVEDAKLLATSLGIEHKLIDISELVTKTIGTLGPLGKEKVAEGNVRARLRMLTLYYAANVDKRLVVGSSDKSELMLGYFTKHGDGGADLLPLGDLYKTQIRELARFLGLPRHIAEKPSSPRLWMGQTAEEELGLGYETIDLILHGLFDLKLSEQRVAVELGIEKDSVRKVLEMVKKSEHKREMPPVARLRI